MLDTPPRAFDDGLTSGRAVSNRPVNIFSLSPPTSSGDSGSAAKRRHRRGKKSSSTAASASPDPPPVEQGQQQQQEKAKSKRQEKKERKKIEWDAKCAARATDARAAAEREGRLEEYTLELQLKEEQKKAGLKTQLQQPGTTEEGVSERERERDNGKGNEQEQPQQASDAEVDFLTSKKKRQRERERTTAGSGAPSSRKKPRPTSSDFPLLSHALSPPPTPTTPTTTPDTLPHKAQLRAQAHALLSTRTQLPIWAHRDTLRHALQQHNILVLLGATGSGKSTQIGQFLVSEPWMRRPGGAGGGGCIAITQPRRVAAIALARRVAAEMGVRLGEEVGYTVRFDNKSHPERTKIKFMTDGMLLQEMLRDPLLGRYAAVVVDEAHERTVGTDLVLGFLRGLVFGERSGGKLKVVVMSATMGVERMKAFFEGGQDGGEEEEEFRGCDIDSDSQDSKDNGKQEAEDTDDDDDKSAVAMFQVPGRQFPVELYHAPEPVADYVDAALRTVFQIHYGEPMPGDILVFLTGQDEIEALQKLVEDYALGMDKNVPKLLVLPLYAALPQAQQQKTFHPAPRNTRKLILSTNIAETSLTLPGVRHVIDTGKHKRKHYRPRINLDSLLITAISKSSALQRTGRAGREAPGKCFRLYTEQQFLSLEEEEVPEILRCDIAAAVLTLKARGVQDLVGRGGFGFIDPPERDSVLKALEQLYALGALDGAGRITALGRSMAVLPVSPALARVLVEAASVGGCLEEVVDIVAALSVESVFVASVRGGEEEREKVEEERRRLERREGDLIVLLGVVREWEAVPVEGRGRWAERYGVSGRAMRSLLDVRNQLRHYCNRLRPSSSSTTPLSTPPSTASTVKTITPPHATRILKCFLTGFFHHTARLVPDGSYRTVIGSQTVSIHPSSVLFGKKAEAIMYFEFVYTTRPFARCVSVVQMDWLVEASPVYLGGAGAAET